MQKNSKVKISGKMSENTGQFMIVHIDINYDIIMLLNK